MGDRRRRRPLVDSWVGPGFLQHELDLGLGMEARPVVPQSIPLIRSGFF